MIISNANSIRLNQNTGTLPDMEDAMRSWFQPMIFTRVQKTVKNSLVVETKTDISFSGVWQPFTAQQLKQMPEGQREWKWFTVHAQIGLSLKPDEIVIYLGNSYRVMEKLDYEIYGYNEYHLVEDYTTATPLITENTQDQLTTEDGEVIVT